MNRRPVDSFPWDETNEVQAVEQGSSEPDLVDADLERQWKEALAFAKEQKWATEVAMQGALDHRKTLYHQE